ncbi:TPA: nucleotidyl transferase AbiEii/AbiGii toxin family protein [Streptococcus pyogenes]|uniref:nucleotidyl transferase AbiEii/AbiGii toxin family protein n=1 Tax=Streptococcus pyogenes TaxID=1314 RepID=UPI001E63C370|nr:nucleotidyl transferase AbiEii/AbiGii toxin family protein [Streptococcus pyogenes]HER4811405.1 nucleotidyl transferase AbiEii/AbiGii toxin family protein [Streptococcus pyogenes NGAS075]UEN80756.1 nucleotidyl transferase AbiEii/AbiGii toxin family protein [Streptococcus pyogenes]HEQ0694666.1 nucleotidyl transferase AbiEii/AbiGii toxin family protein [Streptococcus pyogenes]HEQ0695992.1 nucleotidyl transferase AbiEii/AbiGii toxin family protein [Streptococcus pyogenes]HEQ0846118.1 nucleotid
MIHSSKQLKDLIRNLSKEVGIEAHVLIRKYMMERFLERVSSSKYNGSFILKGGMLVAAFVGVEARATMDIDTTIKGIPVTIVDMERTITEISNIDLDDNVKFRIKKVSEIMDEAEYSGIRFSMDAVLDGAVIPLKIDISTGDVITPREIAYSYKLMFEDRTIPIMTYPIETVLAEKLETVISRSITNTRMRDFYDIHILLKSQNINAGILALALERTAKKRGNFNLLDNAESVLKIVKSDEDMKRLWNIYQKKFKYAGEYTWDEVIHSVRELSIEAKLDVEKISVAEK